MLFQILKGNALEGLKDLLLIVLLDPPEQTVIVGCPGIGRPPLPIFSSADCRSFQVVKLLFVDVDAGQALCHQLEQIWNPFGITPQGQHDPFLFDPQAVGEPRQLDGIHQLVQAFLNCGSVQSRAYEILDGVVNMWSFDSKLEVSPGLLEPVVKLKPNPGEVVVSNKVRLFI